jgi:hypothetical protein
MRRAFKDKSVGWAKAVRKANEAPDPQAALKKLHDEREHEAAAVVAWIQAGADPQVYEKDDFVLPDGVSVKIKSILDERCACCHAKEAGRDRNAEKFELDSYPKLAKYLKVETATAMPLNNLATTTHVHMFGFTIMYCLTGLIFSFTSYPTWARVIVAPAAIVTSVTEIGIGWWMGRLDPCPAAATAVFGGLTGGILLVQIFGSLFDMYAKRGRLVLLALIAGTAVGGLLLHYHVIDPYLQIEKANAAHAHEVK